MNSRSRMIRTASVLVLSLVVTSTMFAAAAGKRRAVNPAAPPAPAAPPTALLTGTILDAATSAPVVGVLVRTGSRSGHTDAHGNFFINLVPGVASPLTFERTGYDPSSASVTITANAAQTFRMNPRPTARVRLTSGPTYDLDPETIEFGYVAPFSGYNKDTKLNLCKAGGESFTPDRTEIKHITPGTQMNDPKCCAQTAIAAINVELKVGGTTTAGFVDACFDYKVDVIALDHLTAAPVYIHFSDIADLTFP
jgi:hypothetical protein